MRMICFGKIWFPRPLESLRWENHFPCKTCATFFGIMERTPWVPCAVWKLFKAITLWFWCRNSTHHKDANYLKCKRCPFAWPGWNKQALWPWNGDCQGLRKSWRWMVMALNDPQTRVAVQQPVESRAANGSSQLAWGLWGTATLNPKPKHHVPQKHPRHFVEVGGPRHGPVVCNGRWWKFRTWGDEDETGLSEVKIDYKRFVSRWMITQLFWARKRDNGVTMVVTRHQKVKMMWTLQKYSMARALGHSPVHSS